MAELALRCARLAVTTAPTDYLIWLGLARTEAILGAWQRAEVALERARQLVRHRAQVRMFLPAPEDARSKKE